MTELVQPFLRVTDNRVAQLRGAVIEGLSPGRAEVQVVSPVTGKVLGAKEFKVAAEKVRNGARSNSRPIDHTRPRSGLGRIFLHNTPLTNSFVVQFN